MRAKERFLNGKGFADKVEKTPPANDGALQIEFERLPVQVDDGAGVSITIAASDCKTVGQRIPRLVESFGVNAELRGGIVSEVQNYSTVLMVGGVGKRG